MPNGGVLKLGVGELRECPTSCKVAPERCTGRCARITVEDTGIGMDERTAERIFEPFFTTKEPGVGTGLGLSTVYGIVEQAHGFVEVQTKLGMGTRFDVILPRIDPVLRARAAVGEQPLPHGTGHVLVVEDDQAVRRLAVRVLRSCGYTVYEAPNGRAALELAQRIPDLDLVISDVVMPGMAGPALIQELATRRPGLRYLLMSGYTSDELERHRAVACEVPLFEKPFSPWELAAKVHASLSPPETPSLRLPVVHAEAPAARAPAAAPRGAGHEEDAAA
jgi:CheY-like chemotaxis protein